MNTAKNTTVTVKIGRLTIASPAGQSRRAPGLPPRMMTGALDGLLEEALAFNAPYVIDRLVRDRVAATPAFAEHLFTEAKRYLVLGAAIPDTRFGMYSAMVDEAWHTFVLFTTEYTDYGYRYFGRFIHHVPADDGGMSAAMPTDGLPENAASFNEFRERYEELFGEPLPAVWYDDDCVAPSRRVINDKAGMLTAVVDDDTVHLIEDTGHIALSVNELASEAMHFIAETQDFYVRELPGGLTADEKVAVITPLIGAGVLRLAP